LTVKPLFWVGRSRDELRGFPYEARREAGYQLGRVQFGEEPTDWRSLTDVGAGVCEIRIHGAVERRVLYVAKFPEAVYVLHAFAKSSRRTPRLNLDVARARWRTLVGARAGRAL
jgi:phage-related protein